MRAPAWLLHIAAFCAVLAAIVLLDALIWIVKAHTLGPDWMGPSFLRNVVSTGIVATVVWNWTRAGES